MKASCGLRQNYVDCILKFGAVCLLFGSAPISWGFMGGFLQSRPRLA